MGGHSGSAPRALRVVDTPDGPDNAGFIVRRVWMLPSGHKWDRTPDECVIPPGDTTHQMVKVNERIRVTEPRATGISNAVTVKLMVTNEPKLYCRMRHVRVR